MKISFPEKEVAEFEDDCRAVEAQFALASESDVDEASFDKFIRGFDGSGGDARIAAFLLRRYIKTGSIFVKEA